MLPNVVHYWGVFRRAKWSLLGWTLAFAMSGVVAAVTTPNTYEATVVAMWTQDRNQLNNRIAIPPGLLDGVGGRLLGTLARNSFGNSNQALTILKSRNFLRRFVERRQPIRKLAKRSALDPDALGPDETRDMPAFQSTIIKLKDTYGDFRERISAKVEELMRKLYKPTAFDREILRDSAPISREARRTRRVSKLIKNALAAERVPRQHLVRVKVRWNNPVIAAELANALVAELNSSLRETAITGARKRISYLNRQLDKTSVIPLRQSIYRLIEAETRTIMVAETRNEYAFRVIDSAEPPNPRRFIRPRRSRMILTTALMGFGIGVFVTILRDSIRMVREHTREHTKEVGPPDGSPP